MAASGGSPSRPPVPPSRSCSPRWGSGESDADREILADLLAKGVLPGAVLATDDLDADFERIAASGADIQQEPMDQPWGVRDAAFRDPAGNHLRLTQH